MKEEILEEFNEKFAVSSKWWNASDIKQFISKAIDKAYKQGKEDAKTEFQKNLAEDVKKHARLAMKLRKMTK